MNVYLVISRQISWLTMSESRTGDKELLQCNVLCVATAGHLLTTSASGLWLSL